MSAGESIPGIPSIPFAAGDGLAAGMGMVIFGSGEGFGLGEAIGICMPGMFICVCGEGEGKGDGDGDGDAFGIFMPGMVRPFSSPFDIVKAKSTLSSARHTLPRIILQSC